MNSKDELVLPSFFTENYFTLLPGENKKILLDFSANSMVTGKSILNLVVEGWNVQRSEIKF
jgi:mannosylglycoprotein endo-beta-mannosidase